MRFDAVPLAHRNAIAVIAEIAGELSTGRIGALLGFVRELRAAERGETP